MGIDVNIFLEHKFFEKNITYTLDKLKEISSLDIIVSNLDNDYEPYYGSGWIISIDEYNSVEEMFEKEKYINIVRKWNTEKENKIWFSKHNFYLIGNEFMFRGRWHYFSKFLIGNMEKDDFDDYKHWFNNFSDRIIEYGKIFNSNSYIMFCGDLNQDISEELWTGEKIENVLKKDMWTIVKDIPYEIIMEKITNYDIPRFLCHKKWENNKFDLKKWRDLFE